MIKGIDISSEFGVIEDLVNKLAATREHANVEKVLPWHPAFR